MCWKNPTNLQHVSTLVPEVFLEFSPHERAVRESRSGEKDKPLVTCFMQTPTVKRVKLIITTGTNGNSASTCLSAINFLTQGRPGKLFVEQSILTRVVKSGITWPTWTRVCENVSRRGKCWENPIEINQIYFQRLEVQWQISPPSPRYYP